MPLASMSNVTSTCGTPRGAGRMPSRMKRPERLVVRRHRALALEHVDLDRRLVVRRRREHLELRVGIVVLRGMIGVATPPSVSMPSVSGVTSSSSTSRTSPLSTPAWMAAPMATTSSGFTPLCGSLPKNFFTFSCTSGMRVCPPTSTTSSIWSAVTLASSSAWRHGLERPLDQVADELLELGARQLDRQVLRARRRPP